MAPNWMSTFDGAHAYAFTARLTDKAKWRASLLGKRFHTRWTAHVDSVRLRDPLELTQSNSEDGRFFCSATKTVHSSIPKETSGCRTR